MKREICDFYAGWTRKDQDENEERQDYPCGEYCKNVGARCPIVW